MRVFDFTLLSGYEFSGVDVAQGFRARLFAKNNVNAKFIFTELPTIRDMELYGSQKIKRGQIMSAHLFMTGRLDMSLSVKKEALLENEKENYEYDYIDENGKVICLYNSGEKSVEILCDEDGFVVNESLFKNGKKYLVNYYTDSLSYTELYNWDNDSSDGLNPERRIFWNKQGQMVYEQCIYKDNVEYLFKNGEVIDNVEFLERFVKALNLCENDICIMDRAGYLDYIQPLFENKGKSKLIAVLHSDHFYKIYEDESSLYMNYEYYYWFKYSEAIDYFVVGTDEHKRSLEAFLKEYDCFVPHIAAIPPGAIPEGKLKSKNTIIFSMVMLSPGRTADDLLKSGDSIQDIYAGKPTKRYLIGTVLSFSVISSIIICICQGGPLFLQFGGYVDASLAMLPCSIMMTTGLWISLYREAEVYRNMDRYHTFI